MEDTLITNLAWGELELTIGEQTFHFKDCKIWPGGAREWNWNETRTHHSPGIQPSDIEEILEHGVEVIVLARGQLGRLGVSTETKDFLRNRGVSYHIEKTRKAVTLFDEMVQKGIRVGGIFHTTC